MLFFVAAHGQNFEIGNNGQLPWRHKIMKDDIARLHVLVDGKQLVMGERTYQNYKNIQAKFKTNQVIVLSRSFKSLPDAELAVGIDTIVERSKNEDLWVIGGGSVFAQLLPYVDKMYLTIIESEFNADVFFPRYSIGEWVKVSEENHKANALNPYPYTFLELKRP